MSKIQANNFVNRDDTGAPDCSRGLTVSSGLLGIGVTNPQDALHIAVPSAVLRLEDTDTNHISTIQSTAAALVLSADATNAVASSYLGLSVDGSERARIDSSGNVGIGSTAPLTTLECRGQFSISNNATSYWVLDRDDSDGRLKLLDSSTSTNEHLAVDSSGRLLVGTSTASLSNKFALQGDTSSANNGGYMRLRTGNSIVSGTSLGSIGFGDAANNGALIEAKGDVSWSPFTKGSRIEFSTTADGASTPTERMRISNSGLHQMFGATGVCYVRSATGAGTAERFFIGYHSATGATTGGTISFNVYTNGNVQNTNNSYGAISDIKLKENIVDANSQWDDLKAIQVRNYNFIEGQTHTQIGVVAQEIETVSPGLVSESPDRDEDGNDLGTVTKSVNYSVLYMKAVKALQEAMERIETLEQRLSDAGIA